MHSSSSPDDFDGVYKDLTYQNGLDSFNTQRKAPSISSSQVPNTSFVCRIALSTAVNWPLGGWMLPVVLSQKCFAWSVSLSRLMPQEARPHTAGKGREEAVRDAWKSSKEIETRGKGRKDYLTLTLSTPAATTGSLSSLFVSPPPPHQDRPVSPCRGGQTCRQQWATEG